MPVRGEVTAQILRDFLGPELSQRQADFLIRYWKIEYAIYKVYLHLELDPGSTRYRYVLHVGVVSAAAVQRLQQILIDEGIFGKTVVIYELPPLPTTIKQSLDFD